MHASAPAAVSLWAPGSGAVAPVSLTPRRKFAQIQWLEMAGFKVRYFQPMPQRQKELIKAENDEKGSEQPIPFLLPILASDNESLA